MSPNRPILFVTNISNIDQPTGYRSRTLSEMECLRDAGVDVTLVALSPYSVLLRSSKRRAFEQELNRRGLKGKLIPNLPGFRNRWGAHVGMSTSALLVAAETVAVGARVIHGENQHATVAALGAARLTGSKVVFDAHGALPEEATLNGEARGFSAARIARETTLARTWERRAWRGADGVVAVSRQLVDHYGAVYGPCRGPAIVVPCATTRAAVPAPAARLKVRAEYGLIGREVVLYVGSLAPYQEAPDMVRLFARVYAQRPSAFLLIVSQSARERWEELAHDNGLPGEAYRIVSARQDEVPALTAAGDVGLMLRRDIVVNAVAFPTKLAEYLAAGVPVLATAAIVDPARFIQDHRVGLVAPGIATLDSRVVGQFLNEVSKNREAWSARCRASAETFLMWPRFGSALIDLYDAVQRLPPTSAAVVTRRVI